MHVYRICSLCFQWNSSFTMFYLSFLFHMCSFYSFLGCYNLSSPSGPHRSALDTHREDFHEVGRLRKRRCSLASAAKQRC